MISALGIASCGNSFSKNTPVQLCFSRGHSHIASVRLSAEDWGIICSVIAEWLNFSLCKKCHIVVYNRRKLCAMQKLPEKRISRRFHEWEKRDRDTLARDATESEATQVKQG